VEGDLQRFKQYIENRGKKTGACRGDQLLVLQLPFNVPHKPVCRTVECLRQFQNDRQCWGFKTSFDLTNIGAVNACLKAQFFLGNAPIFAKFTDFLAE
jgi:hypothetical protein